LVTATLAGQSSQTIEIRLTGTSIEDTYYVPETINGTDTPDNNVGSYVLVLYNADSTGGDVDNVISSTALKKYYKTYRPGMEHATYLRISAALLELAGYDIDGITSLPDTAGSSAANDKVCEAIAQYVSNYVENYLPSTRYIVGLCGLPSGDGARYSGVASVPYRICSLIGTYRNKPDYDGKDPFSVAEYGAPLVAWLDCGSYDATKAYIDKEHTAAYQIGPGGHQGLQADGITISGTAAGVNGTNWTIDDVHTSDRTDYLGCFDSPALDDSVANLDDNTIDFNPNMKLIDGQEVQQHVIHTEANPAAYVSWGYHSGGGLTELRGGGSVDWANNGDLTFSGNAGWWVGASIESFNGMYGEVMADPLSIFSRTAFGSGTNDVPEYANTPVCWVLHFLNG
jgi:hypothetical protein